MPRISIKVVRGSEIPVAQQERLGLPEESDAPVEVYEHHRPPWERSERAERDRQLDEAWRERMGGT